MVFISKSFCLLLSLGANVKITQQLNEMTLEEKVGQVIMAHVNAKEVTKEVETLVCELGVGGIIYYNWANGLDSRDQVKHLSNGMQAISKIPLLIAVDQEGGIVERLMNEFTRWPGNKALGQTNDSSLAYKAGYCIAKELKSVGVNTNFGPVVDVNSNPNNPVIGIRSFGKNPKKVREFAIKAIEGYNDGGVICCAKHAPGHGDTDTDSHTHLPLINKTLKQLQETELVPFKNTPSPMVMTAHTLIPSIDKDNPSTLSKKTLDLFRKECSFNGVIISDSLVMEGVLKGDKKVDEIAIEAFNAGCDMILLGGALLHGQNRFELSVDDVVNVHRSMVQAVRSGKISKVRLNEALERILQLKDRDLLTQDCLTEEDFISHNALALEIAEKALKVKVNNQDADVPIKGKKITIVASKQILKTIKETNLGKIENSTLLEFGEIVKDATEVIIICSCNAHLDCLQREQIRALIDLKKSNHLIVLRNPQDEDLFPDVLRVVKTFSLSKPSLNAIARLFNE